MQRTEPADVGPGTQLGRYEILLGIAQGGMARVWAARQHGQRGFSKVVAIKTILPALASDAEFEAMFLDEAHVAASVHHPNVCEIFDLGEEQGILYLAMEWINGESLARVIKSGPPATPVGPPTPLRLNARIAARIVADACGGLHAAHELCDDAGNRLNVVHRDVSPQNILVSIDGNVKVTDFGVAKALGSSHHATSAGQIKGKAAYMSPEQGAGGRVDRRSDVFALGIVLYEVTTGVRPFSGETQLATLKRLLEGRFEPPSAVLPGYPRELETIVLRAMAMDPMQRFPTTDRMRVALEEWLARSGPIVTQTLVGTAVRERIGSLVDERALQIRERMRSTSNAPPPWTPGPPPATSGPPLVTPGPLVTPAPPSAQAAEAGRVSDTVAASAVSYVATSGSFGVPSSGSPSRPQQSNIAATALIGIAVGLGAFFALAVALGVGWYVLRGRPRFVPPLPSAAEPTTAASALQPTASSTLDKLSTIRLRAVTPHDGQSYELDGIALPGGTSSIDRPKPGRVRLLTARAAGYTKQDLRIDEQTPEVLDVILEEAPVSALTASASARPATEHPAAALSEGAKTERKKKPIKPDIPENPF